MRIRLTYLFAFAFWFAASAVFAQDETTDELNPEVEAEATVEERVSEDEGTVTEVEESTEPTPETVELAGLEWHTNYGRAYHTGIAEKKQVFVYFQPTEPTAESELFEQETLQNEEVRTELAKRILMAVDIDFVYRTEKGEDKTLREVGRYSRVGKTAGYAVLDFTAQAKKIGDVVIVYPFRQIKNFKPWEGQSVAGMLSGRLLPQPEISANAKDLLRYARSNIGRRVGGGGCNALCQHKLGSSNYIGYMGRVELRPGDIMIWSGGTSFGNIFTGPGHYSVVESARGGTVNILHQNMRGSGVRRDRIGPAPQRGSVRIYRPHD